MEQLQNTHRSSPAVRWLALGGVVGSALFVTLIVVAGLLDEGYSHTSQAISELGGEGADYPALQSANFIVFGLLVVGFAWALGRHLGGSLLGPALIAFFGLTTAIGNGVLQCDLGCEGQSTEGLLHNISGVSGFVAAIVGMFVLVRRWRPDPTWQSHARFTRVIALVALGGLVAFIATQGLEAEAVDGLAQRVFAAALLIFIAVTALRLHREVSRSAIVAASSSTRSE